MSEEKDAPRGFEVKDRRRFSETGEARTDVPEAAPEATPSMPSASEVPRAPAESSPSELHLDEAATFSTFILGLSTQALFLLGEIPNPETRAIERDLDGAKQVIDILGILQEKTRNNLDPGESSLLDSILYDLRMRYVELVRRGSKEGA